MAMSRFSIFKRRKQLNNKKNVTNSGFSLIEALVAIAILAVLSLPIIQAFTSSAKVNLSARRQENANTVSQRVIENLKAKTVEQVLAEMGITDSSTVISGDVVTLNMGDFDAKGKKYTGTSDGDKFYVKVTLDPADFTDNAGHTGNINNNINSFDMPVFTDIYSPDVYAIMAETFQFDREAASQLGVEISEMVRKINVNVSLNKANGSGAASYTQSVSISVTYTADGTTTSPYTAIVSRPSGVTIDDSKKYKDVYLFYNPLSASDEVKFNVDWGNIDIIDNPRNMNFYLVEQGSIPISEIRVTETVNGIDKNPIETTDLGQNGTLGIATFGKINIFTNASKIKSTTVNNSITSSGGATSQIKKLYNMKVEVWVNDVPANGNDPFWTVTSTKENEHE